MKKLAFLFVFCLMSVQAQADTKNIQVNNHIAFAGDSIAFGMAHFGHFKNAGVIGSGLTTKNVEKKDKYWSLHSKDADLVIIEVGTNDFNFKGSSAQYKELLSQYILPMGSQRICIAQIPLAEKTNVRNGVIRLKPILQSWAYDNNIKIVPFPNFDPVKDRAPDGIHFTGSAYKKIANNLLHTCSQ